MKRFILILSIIVLTISCLLIMNRNYDPLARYPYDDELAREKILENLDEREIKYIIDYSIAPSEFMKFIDCNNFNAYNTSYYNRALLKLYYLEYEELVNVVNMIVSKKYDFDSTVDFVNYKDYHTIMGILEDGDF